MSAGNDKGAASAAPTPAPSTHVEPLGYISAYGLEKLQTRRHYCVSVSYQAEREYVIPIFCEALSPQMNVDVSDQIDAAEVVIKKIISDPSPETKSLRLTTASKPEAQSEKDNAGKSDDDGPHPSVGSPEGAVARAVDEVPIVADVLQYSSQDENRPYDSQQPFLHQPHYHSTVRTAILEEAAKVAETGDWYGQFQTAGDERRAKAIAERIRALATTEGAN